MDAMAEAMMRHSCIPLAVLGLRVNACVLLQGLSDSCSAISGLPTGQRRPRSESRGGLSRRSRSLDRSNERGRRRSRSYERRPPWEKGFWAYVPPPDHPLIYGRPPVSVLSSTPRAVPAVMQHNVLQPPPPTVLHTPVVYPSMTYMSPQLSSKPGRVYLKDSLTTPSKPKASVYISKPRFRKAKIYVMTSDDDDDNFRRYINT